jgi:methionine-rich copper-binding protein CopC
MRTARTTAALRGAVIATLAGVAVLFAAAPAGAHSVLADSTPEEGEVLTELPAAFSVTANEPLLDLGGQGVFLLQIRDAGGAYYGDGCVEVVDATMSATPALGASGDYTMIWQVVSADGHPVSGEVRFRWDAPADFEPSDGFAEPPVCGGIGDDVTDTSSSPTRLEVALGILIALAVAGVAAAVIVAATRRRRAT